MPKAIRFVEVDPVEADRRRGHGFWSRVAGRVMYRPVLIGGPILVVLLLAGTPFLRIQLSTGGNLEDLPDTPAKEGFLILRDDFPGGDTDPMIAAVTYGGVADLTDGELTPDRLADLQAYVDEVSTLPDIQDVESVLNPPPGIPADQYLAILGAPQTSWPPGLADWVAQTVAGDTTKVTVFSTRLPDTDAGRELVAEVRDVPDPTGSTVGVTGLAARSADFMDSFRASVPVAVAIVIAVTLVVLFLTFGSVFLPVKAVLMSLISITASFGALVWIFQEGHLSGLLGFEATGSLGAWLPILMFAILFGLSMDYEVLLLSRDPGALDRDRQQHPGRGRGDRDHGRDHHRRGAGHGRRLLGLRAVGRAVPQGHRVLDGPGRAHRRHDRAWRAGARFHAGHGPSELVGPGLGPARGREAGPVRGSRDLDPHTATGECPRVMPSGR